MEETPMLRLLSLLTTSIHTIEDELRESNMPPFTLDPTWHPLDAPTAVPSPRLHEARRVAMASANMIRALVQDVGTALSDMSMRMLDTSAYILTADIGLMDVFRTDEERTTGLSVSEMVARLPEGKKVNPQKLARCLRLLSVDHWWTEPSQGVFAPTRWALLNTPGSPTWAWSMPAWGALAGIASLTEHMTNPATMDVADIESAPWALAWRKSGRSLPEEVDWWKWVAREPEMEAKFAHSMEGIGYMNIASIEVDYPWESLPPNSTLVDVGAGQGSVALHVLKRVYTKIPTLKAVLQDYAGPLKRAQEYWAQELPEAIADGRIEFEVHDFFEENPRREPNTIYWFRFVMHDWHDDYAIRILRQIRAVCHPTSRVLLADCLMLEAIPSRPGDFGGGKSFAESLDSIDNTAPISAPYPVPRNFGFATKGAHQLNILMLNNFNALERTRAEFETIVTAAGFKVDKITLTRGSSSIIEIVPN